MLKNVCCKYNELWDRLKGGLITKLFVARWLFDAVWLFVVRCSLLGDSNIRSSIFWSL